MGRHLQQPSDGFLTHGPSEPFSWGKLLDRTYMVDHLYLHVLTQYGLLTYACTTWNSHKFCTSTDHPLSWYVHWFYSVCLHLQQITLTLFMVSWLVNGQGISSGANLVTNVTLDPSSIQMFWLNVSANAGVEFGDKITLCAIILTTPISASHLFENLI